MERRRQVVWAAVVVALVLAGGSLAAEGGFRRYWRLKQDMRSLEERNARVAEENERLQREVQRLRGDRRTQERAAREELGLVRPGEIVFNVEGS